MRGIDVGGSAMQILASSTWEAATGPTIVQARERIEHIKATKEELWEAVAYLALQANTYRAMSGQDAHLALVNIERTVLDYRMRTKK